MILYSCSHAYFHLVAGLHDDTTATGDDYEKIQNVGNIGRLFSKVMSTVRSCLQTCKCIQGIAGPRSKVSCSPEQTMVSIVFLWSCSSHRAHNPLRPLVAAALLRKLSWHMASSEGMPQSPAATAGNHGGTQEQVGVVSSPAAVFSPFAASQTLSPGYGGGGPTPIAYTPSPRNTGSSFAPPQNKHHTVSPFPFFPNPSSPFVSSGAGDWSSGGEDRSPSAQIQRPAVQQAIVYTLERLPPQHLGSALYVLLSELLRMGLFCYETYLRTLVARGIVSSLSTHSQDEDLLVHGPGPGVCGTGTEGMMQETPCRSCSRHRHLQHIMNLPVIASSMTRHHRLRRNLLSSSFLRHAVQQQDYLQRECARSAVKYVFARPGERWGSEMNSGLVASRRPQEWDRLPQPSVVLKHLSQFGVGMLCEFLLVHLVPLGQDDPCPARGSPRAMAFMREITEELNERGYTFNSCALCDGLRTPTLSNRILQRSLTVMEMSGLYRSLASATLSLLEQCEENSSNLLQYCISTLRQYEWVFTLEDRTEDMVSRLWEKHGQLCEPLHTRDADDSRKDWILQSRPGELLWDLMLRHLSGHDRLDEWAIQHLGQATVRQIRDEIPSTASGAATDWTQVCPLSPQESTLGDESMSVVPATEEEWEAVTSSTERALQWVEGSGEGYEMGKKLLLLLLRECGDEQLSAPLSGPTSGKSRKRKHSGGEREAVKMQCAAQQTKVPVAGSDAHSSLPPLPLCTALAELMPMHTLKLAVNSLVRNDLLPYIASPQSCSGESRKMKFFGLATFLNSMTQMKMLRFWEVYEHVLLPIVESRQKETVLEWTQAISLFLPQWMKTAAFPHLPVLGTSPPNSHQAVLLLRGLRGLRHLLEGEGDTAKGHFTSLFTTLLEVSQAIALRELGRLHEVVGKCTHALEFLQILLGLSSRDHDSDTLQTSLVLAPALLERELVGEALRQASANAWSQSACTTVLRLCVQATPSSEGICVTVLEQYLHRLYHICQDELSSASSFLCDSQRLLRSLISTRGLNTSVIEWVQRFLLAIPSPADNLAAFLAKPVTSMLSQFCGSVCADSSLWRWDLAEAERVEDRVQAHLLIFLLFCFEGDGRTTCAQQLLPGFLHLFEKFVEVLEEQVYPSLAVPVPSQRPFFASGWVKKALNLRLKLFGPLLEAVKVPEGDEWMKVFVRLFAVVVAQVRVGCGSDMFPRIH